MHPLKRSALAVAVFGALAPASFGATIAYTDAGSTKGTAQNNLNIGREFQVGAGGITVSDLGVFDFGHDGLVTSHDVTLFSITGSGANPAPEIALSTVNVPSGTSATLDGGFRFSSIAPIFLPAGNYAVIAYGTEAGSGDPYGDGGAVPSSPAVTHLGWDPFQFTTATSPSFPTPGDDGNHSSTSFHYDIGNTTPEPGSLTVLAVGGALALGRRRRV